MQTPIQQTKKWQKFLEQTGAKTFFEQTEDYTFLAELKSTPLGNYLYTPCGPYTQSKNGLKKALKALESIAKAENAMFIRIEPEDVENLNFLRKTPNVKKSHDLHPADTWILDLAPDQNTLYSHMKQNTRNLCRNYTKKGLKVTTSKDPSDIKYLVNLQQKLAKVKKIGVYDKKYLKTELKQDFATLYLVHYTPENSKKSKIIAASLFFDHENTRYYMQSASDYNYRKLPATIALLNDAIMDAKEKGLKKFDFWGIAPDGAPKDHPWAGFTDFKKSFGGEAVHYCGTWDIILNPTKYNLYQILRKINKIKRKIIR